MKLAIIGAGTIGTTIGRRWQDKGHEIVYGVRDPGQSADRLGGAPARPISAAVDGADAVLIAIPGNAVENLLSANRDALDGRLLLDASNNTGGERFHQLPLFAAQVPTARVYRAFCTLGWENFAEPEFDGIAADLFYSGPAGGDQSLVEKLIADVGLRPIYVGADAAGADVVDGVTRLWFTLALRLGHGRKLAFRTLGLA